MIKIEDASKILKLAGGNVPLAVHSTGKVQLESGSGKLFELNNCLYVPELSQNMLAGGAMLKKGVQVLVHPKDSNCFSLVFKGEALFNGVFATNNLMYVALEPVSPLHDSTACSTQTEDLSQLQHRRLGHLSHWYLKIMSKHRCVEGLPVDVSQVKESEVFSLSKNTKIPH